MRGGEGGGRVRGKEGRWQASWWGEVGRGGRGGGTAWSIEPHAWHWLGSGHAPARWPNSPQLLQVLPASLRPRLSLPSPRSRRSRGADFSLWRDSIRHLILRCPVLPQMSHVLSRFGQSATCSAAQRGVIIRGFCVRQRRRGRGWRRGRARAGRSRRSAASAAAALRNCRSGLRRSQAERRTACEVDPQAWHWLGSEHAPARWPNWPQLLQVLPPSLRPPPPPPPDL
jgi:hypothetical protein